MPPEYEYTYVLINRVRPIVLSLAFSTMFNSTMACSPAPEGGAIWRRRTLPPTGPT
jgi:hypothetical protein